MMGGELVVDGRELISLSEEKPDRGEVIIEMMLEAEEELLAKGDAE